MNCLHKNFHGQLTINRIDNSDRFFATVKVRCADCGKPFLFTGQNNFLISVDRSECKIGLEIDERAEFISLNKFLNRE